MKLFRVLLALLPLAFGIAHAQVKISALPAASAQVGSEILPEYQAGQCASTSGTCGVTTAQIRGYIEGATNTWTGTNIWTGPSTYTAPLVLGSPTGGAQGAGTMNAQGVYVQGVPVPSYPQTAAEIAAGVTPTNYLYPAGNVLRYGTNTTPGTTDMTAAFTSAVSQWSHGGSPVYAPAGTYLVGTIYYPNGFGFVFEGDGPSQTVLVANANNIPVLQKMQTTGAMDEGKFSGFSIKAYASASATSTTGGFDTSGLRSATIEKVFGLSNAGGYGFASLFSMSAYPYVDYGNHFIDCGLEQQSGWTKVWDFNNGGTSNSADNSNQDVIVNPWIYANNGLAYGIDAARSADVLISGGLIEENTGATAINSGNTTTIQSVWFELNAHNIAYATYGDGTSNNGTAIGNYFSTADTISFSGVEGNTWIGNVEPGAQTWAGNNGSNVKLEPTSSGIVTSGMIVLPGVTCSMSAGTTCTTTVPSGSVHCAAYAQGATAYYAACGISGTTATVTADASNSATWLVQATQ